MELRNFIIKVKINDLAKVKDYLKSINEPISTYWNNERICALYGDEEYFYIGFLDDEDQDWDCDLKIYWERSYSDREIILFKQLLRKKKIKRIL